jgi:hypothetical protein
MEYKSVGSTCRLYCNTCCRETYHELKAVHQRSEPEYAYKGQPAQQLINVEFLFYCLWVCQGCQTGVLEIAYTHMDMVDPRTNAQIWVSEFYPPREEDPFPPRPHPRIPWRIRQVYEEARRVFPYSSRSAAALMRLAIEQMCVLLCEELRKTDPSVELGDLNTNIRTLVRAGLARHIQQALDTVRLVGNQAVHPGQLDSCDDREMASSLFRLVNVIVEDLMAKGPEIESLYSSLPQSKRDYIEQRDRR